MAFVVVLDACVLHSYALRDLLIELRGRDLYQCHWTRQIEDEWVRSVLRANSHLKPPNLDKTRRLMNEIVPDALVTFPARLINSVELPDPNDRHVVAAA